MAETQQQYYEGVGRRKEATARARLYVGGAGKITINDRELSEYFGRETDVAAVKAPLALTGADTRYNVSVHVKGGGITGQAVASQMAIARALLKIDEEYRSPLRSAGYLSRDAREKERKKPGLKRARKAPTYTKR
ncbi:MAG: 30S ribosomal protein S9 [Anaerolineae bacterium]|nr:30S ribosomal protein S9 [Thermoflexales bacterium]MDW8408474.1 30S ribosomal protein S9 [Anaerolineae bacterium]